MRKLLVASQKSGVGKTTSSINLAAAAARAGTRVLLLDADPLSRIAEALRLAQHPRRKTLHQIGVDLPGVLVCDVRRGWIVLSPYRGRPRVPTPTSTTCSTSPTRPPSPLRLRGCPWCIDLARRSLQANPGLRLAAGDATAW